MAQRKLTLYSRDLDDGQFLLHNEFQFFTHVAGTKTTGNTLYEPKPSLLPPNLLSLSHILSLTSLISHEPGYL